MIIHLKNNTDSNVLDDIAKQLKAFHIKKEGLDLMITSSGLNQKSKFDLRQNFSKG